MLIKPRLANVIKLKIRGETFVILSTHALSRGSAVTSNCSWEDLSPIPQLRTALDLTKMFAASCLHSIYIYASQNNNSNIFERRFFKPGLSVLREKR